MHDEAASRVAMHMLSLTPAMRSRADLELASARERHSTQSCASWHCCSCAQGLGCEQRLAERVQPVAVTEEGQFQKLHLFCAVHAEKVEGTKQWERSVWKHSAWLHDNKRYTASWLLQC